jgi:predicted RNA methylase
MKKQIVLSTSANWLRLSLILCVLLSLAAGRVSAEATGDARQIASAANFHGGLVIHIGCGHGQLTAALRLADNCTVQGLDTDPAASKRLAPPFAKAGSMGPFQ